MKMIINIAIEIYILFIYQMSTNNSLIILYIIAIIMFSHHGGHEIVHEDQLIGFLLSHDFIDTLLSVFRSVRLDIDFLQQHLKHLSIGFRI